MLDSLHIRNYRNLKDLKIDSLGRVNLITGKNNTGKSSLLEALAIYATSGDLRLILELLERRGETIASEKMTSPDFSESNLKALSSMFYGRKVGLDADEAISIGSAKEDDSALSIRLIDHTDEEQVDFRKIFIEIKLRDKCRLFPIDRNLYGYSSLTLEEVLTDSKILNVHFVKPGNADMKLNGMLFDAVALTEKEQIVIDALKIVEPLTERIGFVGNLPSRRAVVKLLNLPHVLPLQSMGDGMTKVLTIILALVNCDDGYLFIDEFENGLHYTVQATLWEMILNLSRELNVQVFATTHSDDCIRGFGAALNASDNPSDGNMVRLDNRDGIIKPVQFDAEELKIASKQNIEIR